MNNFLERLKAFLHDPVDKCLDIPTHINRAKKYAKKLGVFLKEEEVKGADQVASCMERSFLPSGITQEFTEIIHPLSEGRIEVKEEIDKKEVFSKIEEICENIGKEISSLDDEKKKFFWLWRNLQDRLFEGLRGESWVKFLSVFPADTRIPDHSIWEHLKIASAINAFWDEESKKIYQNNSLFLFTIGPVQSFINQARKTQDFYMGSFMLSYLTFIAMKEVIDKYGPNSIIYPDLYKQPLMDWFLKKNLRIDPIDFREEDLLLPTFPNRFVAIVPESREEEIRELARTLKNSVKEEVRKAEDKILEKLEIELNEEQRKIFKTHLEEFPQIYWVAVPWKIGDRDITIKDFENLLPSELIEAFKNLYCYVKKHGEFPPNIGFFYGLLYMFLEKGMGIRKNLRKFNQNEERGRKCSLCGERNVLFFKKIKEPEKFAPLNSAKDLTGKVFLRFLKDGEGLCGVCFIKRCFEKYLESEISSLFKNISFPSTAEVACANFKERALEKAGEEFENYQKKFEKLLEEESKEIWKTQWIQPVPKLIDMGMKKTLEGHWFYEENLREKEFEKNLEIYLPEEKINELKNSLKELTKKIGTPSSYYAVIKLDGDNMGKWLSGELLPDIQFAYNSEVWNKLPDEFKKGLKNHLKNFDIEEKNKNKKKSRKLLTPAIHASISTALRNYALGFVRKIVEEEHLGKLVYAGGDDVLAFVNLKDLWDVMHKLRAAFSGQVKINEENEIEVDWSNASGFVEKDRRYIFTMGAKATASMGVVIAHYKTPLQIVLNKVSEALEKAKSYKNKEKDAFCIGLMKRSGEERWTELKWRYEGLDSIEKIKRISKNFNRNNKEGYFSSRFIYKLQEEFARLKKNSHLEIYSEAFEIELFRLLMRAYNGNKKGEEKREQAKEFLNSLIKVYNKTEERFDNFINFLLIVSFVEDEILKSIKVRE